MLLAASVSAHAQSQAFARLDPSPFFERGGMLAAKYSYPFPASHAYSIENSGPDETVQVCYSVSICPGYSLAEKNIRECENVTVPAGKTVSGNHRTNIVFVPYQAAWNYGCSITAQTDIGAPEQATKTDIQHFTVKPWA